MALRTGIALADAGDHRRPLGQYRIRQVLMTLLGSPAHMTR